MSLYFRDTWTRYLMNTRWRDWVMRCHCISGIPGQDIWWVHDGGTELWDVIVFQGYLDKIFDEYTMEGLSYFEMNLETWRQLWRVLEMSDVILLIVDIRYPVSQMFYYIRGWIKKILHLILYRKIGLYWVIKSWSIRSICSRQNKQFSSLADDIIMYQSWSCNIYRNPPKTLTPILKWWFTLLLHDFSVSNQVESAVRMLTLYLSSALGVSGYILTS